MQQQNRLFFFFVKRSHYYKFCRNKDQAELVKRIQHHRSRKTRGNPESVLSGMSRDRQDINIDWKHTTKRCDPIRK